MAQKLTDEEFRDQLDKARASLDHWEHYADHPEFIHEAGGQAAYDKELDARFKRFYQLNTTKR